MLLCSIIYCVISVLIVSLTSSLMLASMFLRLVTKFIWPNQNSTSTFINLKGLAIGDGLCDPENVSIKITMYKKLMEKANNYKQVITTKMNIVSMKYYFQLTIFTNDWSGGQVLFPLSLLFYVCMFESSLLLYVSHSWDSVMHDAN